MLTKDDIADLSEAFTQFDNKMYSWKTQVYSSIPGISDDECIREVENLLEQGVMFTTPTFKDIARSVHSTKEFVRRTKLSRGDKSFVIVEDEGGVTYGVGAYDSRREDNYHKVASVDCLPEHYKEKMFLLRLVEPSNFIPEVGYRGVNGIFILLCGQYPIAD
jgi:hypothetical protein